MGKLVFFAVLFFYIVFLIVLLNNTEAQKAETVEHNGHNYVLYKGKLAHSADCLNIRCRGIK
jgi:hypothetical protein